MQLSCNFCVKGFQGLARLLALTFIFSVALPATAESASIPGLSGIVDAVKSAGSTSGSTSGSSGDSGAAHEAPKAQASASSAKIVKVSPPPGVSANAADKLRLNWLDAQAYCEREGGRLPLIGGKKADSTSPRNGIPGGTPIEGIGVVGGPWPSSLHEVRYWTGTASTFRKSEENAWEIQNRDGKITAVNAAQHSRASQVCVK